MKQIKNVVIYKNGQIIGNFQAMLTYEDFVSFARGVVVGGHLQACNYGFSIQNKESIIFVTTPMELR